MLPRIQLLSKTVARYNIWPFKTPFFFFFFFQNNYTSQTILLVSQDFETILVSNKLSAENSILLWEIALVTRVWDTRVWNSSVRHSIS